MVIKNVSLETVIGVTSKIPDNQLPEIAFAGKSNVFCAPCVNSHAFFGIILCQINRSPGGAVNNRLGLYFFKQGLNSGGIGNIQILNINANCIVASFFKLVYYIIAQLPL